MTNDRARRVLRKMGEIFTFPEYVKHHPNHRSTAWRDWKKLLTTNVIQDIGPTLKNPKAIRYSVVCPSVSGKNENSRKVFKG